MTSMKGKLLLGSVFSFMGNMSIWMYIDGYQSYGNYIKIVSSEWELLYKISIVGMIFSLLAISMLYLAMKGE